MSKIPPFKFLAALWVACVLFFFSIPLAGKERFQVELFGGISFVNPSDFNLLSQAEQQYNDIYFIQRLRYYSGYFVNDFPKIRETIPAGLRLKYSISDKLSFSLGLEGFIRKKEKSIEGSFGYVSTASENHTKIYDPYRLGLSGYSVLVGAHYLIPLGIKTDIELGASAGWTFADIEFYSNWSYRAVYQGASLSYDSVDEGVLEGNGSGDGFEAQAMLRLNRMIARRLGFFVETAYTHCRLKSIEGTGSETRTGLARESSWEGTWGIKKEEIRVRWGSADVYVPTNYWGGGIAAQRERDFVLDLSGFRLVVGFYLRL
jgi:hypothetical protein